MIPVSQPDLSGNEKKYVVEAIESSWISSSGEFVDRFEQDFAQRCDALQCSTVCNGTAALHLALEALGIGPGDEVVVPALTFVATANAVAYTGATPIFVDVDPHHWCMHPSRFEEAITPRTRAVIPVHLYGHPCDMDKIVEIADEHNVFVVEDAAEAHGAKYKGRPVGSLGDLATFSFYGNKILTSGEGGAITVRRSQRLSDKIRLLRGQGMDPKHRYFHSVVGYNYRLTNVACAILCAQIERMDEMLERRAKIAQHYRMRLHGLVEFQNEADWATTSNWTMPIVVPGPRDRLANSIRQQGIDTRPFFVPMNQLPPYTDGRRLECAEALGSSGLCLPLYPTMADSAVDCVIDTLKRWL